jgi:oxygen-independent coproporphyrinogen-3 oxidase
MSAPQPPRYAAVRHLYLHIPFCARRCAYCDFNSYANLEHRIAAYVAALCDELAAWRALADPAPPLQRVARALMRADLPPTIFFGGGTPSLLPLAAFERILAASDALIPRQHAEITVECNPGTALSRDYLAGLRSLGVNRISIGVQTLDDRILRVLGRTHTAADARAAYDAAVQAGFDRINVDFIFGLPGQTPESWLATLHTLVEWQVDHCSLYSLILEPSTPLAAQVTGGRITVPDDDDTGAMYEAALDILAAGGYTQYEISNWARRLPGDAARLVPANACHHNLAYWLNADYLGAGAGAHGHIPPHRTSHVLAVDDYIAAVRRHGIPLADLVPLTGRDLFAETMFMGLRLNAGVSLAHIRERCGVALDAIAGETVAELVAAGLLERDAHAVRLTDRGRMFGNQVFAHFV